MMDFHLLQYVLHLYVLLFVVVVYGVKLFSVLLFIIFGIAGAGRIFKLLNLQVLIVFVVVKYEQFFPAVGYSALV